MDDMIIVAGLIELMLNYHKQGLAVLLGRVRPPRGRAVHDMISALYSSEACKGLDGGYGDRSSFADKVIADNERLSAAVELAGGWPNIYDAARRSIRADGLTWRLVSDYLGCIGTCSVRHKSRLGLLAAKYKMTVREVINRRNRFAHDLAALILNTKEGAYNSEE
ncbi:MAG: hypothetical protein IJ520_02620 [Synergistaceae bacterium]|nr:hypothetical protein [Synergistaceae bacterium]